MSQTTLDFGLKAGMKHITPSQWYVLMCLILHSNSRGRCWPSMDTIAKTTGLSLDTITEAKKWLIDRKALQLVPYDKRMGDDETSLPRRQHIYELTGYLYTESDSKGEMIVYLYMNPDILKNRTSGKVELPISETKVYTDKTEVYTEKPLSAIADVETVSSDTVTVTLISPKPSKPAKTPKPVKRLHTKTVKDELLPVLVKYGKGRTLESYTTSEFNILMKTGMSQVLTALQPLDDEKPIDAMELDAAFKWFKRQYKDAVSYPCGANTVAKMLSDYRAYVRNLKSPKPTLATPAIDTWLQTQPVTPDDAPDAEFLEQIRLARQNGEIKL